MAAINEDDLIKALDGIMDPGVSRLKIDVDDNEGVRKKYHHGRCDVESPFATGELYDFFDGCS